MAKENLSKAERQRHTYLQGKAQKLSTYLEKTKQSLSSKTPDKHQNRAESYQAFLETEAKKTQKRLDAIAYELR